MFHVFNSYCFIKARCLEGSWRCQWEFCVDRNFGTWLVIEKMIDVRWNTEALICWSVQNQFDTGPVGRDQHEEKKNGHLSPGTYKLATWTNRLHNILMHLASTAASKITIHRLWNETPFTLFMLHAWLSAKKASHIGTTICQGEEPLAQW